MGTGPEHQAGAPRADGRYLAENRIRDETRIKKSIDHRRKFQTCEGVGILFKYLCREFANLAYSAGEH